MCGCIRQVLQNERRGGGGGGGGGVARGAGAKEAGRGGGGLCEFLFSSLTNETFTKRGYLMKEEMLLY